MYYVVMLLFIIQDLFNDLPWGSPDKEPYWNVNDAKAFELEKSVVEHCVPHTHKTSKSIFYILLFVTAG